LPFGPLLFLLFVNELPSWIVNDIKMFADDTKMWRKIQTQSDSQTLQADLDSLMNWSQKWLLKFNPVKCKDFLLIYKTYIRPHLEYCVQAWSPHLVKDVQCLERVQKAATNQVLMLRKCSYTDRLRKLGLTTLQTRRKRGDMIEVYKIMTGKERVAGEQFFQLADNEHGLRGHTMKIRKLRSSLDIRKYFFSQRIVNCWNGLPQQVVDATSINSFKNMLDDFWEDMDDISSIA